MTAAPEFAVRPALFLAVIFDARFGVGAKFFGNEALVAPEAGIISAEQEVCDRVRSKDSRSQRFYDALRRERIKS